MLFGNQFNGNVQNGFYRNGKMTAARRVLSHLVRNAELLHAGGHITGPETLAQDGIARACELTRQHASLTLTKLRERGWVKYELLHIAGKPRKVRVFKVTPLAMVEVFNRDVQL